MKIYVDQTQELDITKSLNFKKEILFFDKILFDKSTYHGIKMGVEQFGVNHPNYKNLHHNKTEIDFLIDNKLMSLVTVDDDVTTTVGEILFESDTKSKQEKEFFLSEMDILFNQHKMTIEKTQVARKKILALMRIGINARNRIEYEALLKTLRQRTEFVARFYSLMFSISTNDEYYTNMMRLNAKKHDVTFFLFNKIPVMDTNASWEEIIEYKSDKDVQRKYFALINWVNEVASSSLNISEIKDKFEYLYREYEYQLDLHKKKKSTTTFQVILNSPLEAAENLVKLNFGKILNPFFNISKGKMDLLEAETKITGRELGYIFDVNKKFR